jgi:hypothetical protein
VRVHSIAGRVSVLGCVLLTVTAGCGSGSRPSRPPPGSLPPLTVAAVQAAFGGQGIQLTLFSGAQLVSANPPTVEVEVLASAAKAKAISAPQEVNGVAVEPVGARNILVWVDSHASTSFQQRVSAALAALQGR